MHRKLLLSSLEQYRTKDAEDVKKIEAIRSFVVLHSNCFDRSLKIGHITGSAWIVNKERTKVLLTHHCKLNIWIQPGGHADGESDILEVALREAVEETGLKSIRVLSQNIFDIDIHTIPQNDTVREHLHHDIRYLFEADSEELPIISDESHDVVWILIEEIENVTREESVLRMCRKL